MSEAQAPKTVRGIECPSCGCRQLFVLYTRHRVSTIVRVRRCRHCHRRIVTYERMVGGEVAEEHDRE